MARKKQKRKKKSKKTVSDKYKKLNDLNDKIKNMIERQGLSLKDLKFIEPVNEVKMSAVILKLSEPLLRKYGNNDKQLKTIISLTIITWNSLMFPEDEQERLQGEVIDQLVPMNGEAEHIGSLVYINDLIAERKKKYFPNLKKVILNYDLSVSRGNITLNVTSAPI